MSSTELVQEQKSAGQNYKRNPEMEIGSDGAKEIAGTVGGISQFLGASE